jgi:hypothetical protein
MNSCVKQLHDEWRSIGSPQQDGFDWSTFRTHWEVSFPEHIEFFRTLPLVLDRHELRKVSGSPDLTVLNKFLTTMIWGYSNRGYGPFRVRKMLSQPNFSEVLAEAYQLANLGKPKEAFAYLNKYRINTLGPSYSSKFICFATPREIGAPIYDSQVFSWLKTYASNQFGNLGNSPHKWDVESYIHYWDWVKANSTDLGCFPDEVELLIFRDSELKDKSNSIWVNK